MEENEPILSYPNELYASLRTMHTTASVAEIHGLITGVVCAGVYANGRSWIDSVLGILYPHHHKKNNNRQILLHLYYLLCEQLNEPGSQFQLLLPEKYDNMIARAQALTDWCNGFLAGLRAVGLTDYNNCSSETSDALHHCVEIAKLDYDNIQCNEKDRTAFSQVTEYVRLSAILVHSEFAGGDIRPHARQLRQMQPFMPSEETVH